MTDLVARLRNAKASARTKTYAEACYWVEQYRLIAPEAADEIERLRAQVAKLKAGRRAVALLPRERFEAAVEAMNLGYRRENMTRNRAGEYHKATFQLMWLAWQAATRESAQPPREPTPEMLRAAYPVYNHEMTCLNIWRAMWDASPQESAPEAQQPPASGQEDALAQRLRDRSLGNGVSAGLCADLRRAADAIDRLAKAEKERDRLHVKLYGDGTYGYVYAHDKAMMARDALRAENERLRGALSDARISIQVTKGNLGEYTEGRSVLETAMRRIDRALAGREGE